MPKKGKATFRRIVRSPSLGSEVDAASAGTSTRVQSAKSRASTRTRNNRNGDVQGQRNGRFRRSPSSPTSDPIPSDYELFCLSDSPEEDWGEDEEGEWPVKAIAGQEVLGNREIRYSVEWDGWSRPDGTSTTWTIGIGGDNNLIPGWDAKRSKCKSELAKQSPDIDLNVLGSYMPHDFRTAEDAVAYREKWRYWSKNNRKPEGWKEWLTVVNGNGESSNLNEDANDTNANAKIEERDELSVVSEDIAVDVVLRKSKKRKREGSIWRDMSVSASASTSVSGSAQMSRTSSSSRLVEGEDISSMTLIGSPVPSDSRSSTSSMQVRKQPQNGTIPVQNCIPTPLHCVNHQREQLQAGPVMNQESRQPPAYAFGRLWLQQRWNSALERTGAAQITITNDIYTNTHEGSSSESVLEKFPALASFRYLEDRYTYVADVPNPRTEEKKLFMIGCECEDGKCDDVSVCSCLMESDCIDDHGRATPVYDKERHFLFNNQREVVECNENCACKCVNRYCNNSVAQRPRSIPIDIFTTLRNGWGARSPFTIKKGTVLGLYTGHIIKRKHLDILSAEERDYTFDLDIRDDDDQFLSRRYTVCAYREGNWTRFVNHSCSPNTVVYSVVFDAPLEENMPYVAFVASQDIPPLTEITVDYNPSAARDPEITTQSNGKKRGKKMAGPKGRGRKGKAEAKVKTEGGDEDVEMEMEMVRSMVLDSESEGEDEGRTRCRCGSAACRGFI